MEVVVYCFLTSIWWAVSVTVLLPLLILLKCNKFLRDMWFAHIYVAALKIFVERQFMPMRKKAFELINERLLERDISKPLKVLEIGIASGLNLSLYPENSHLTALDMNANFFSYFKKNQKQYPHITYERTIVSVAENMKEVDDNSMDLVIATYLLCSVTSPRDVLKEIKRVLKPGGLYLFLEHVSYPKSEWGFTIQNFTEPIWNIYIDGCCLTRNSIDVIKNAGFLDVECKKVYPKTIMVYLRPQDYGLATK